MTPGKENFIFFEDLSRVQHRLYDDACDVGIVVDADLHKAISENAAALAEIYKVERYYGDTVLPRESTWSMFIAWEMEDGVYIGTKMKLTYVQERKRSRNLLMLDLTRHSQKESPFKDD